MKRIIIGITGLARSGKTTAANFLVEENEFRVISFADPVKAVCASVFQIPKECFEVGDRNIIQPGFGMSYRAMLQELGTDLVRCQIDPDFWVKIASYALSKLPVTIPVVIPDVRFENEATWIREQSGIIIRLVRKEAGLPDDLGRHVSESGIAHNNKDFIVENNSTVDDLYTNIEAIYDFAKFNSEAGNGQ